MPFTRYANQLCRRAEPLVKAGQSDDDLLEVLRRIRCVTGIERRVYFKHLN